MSYPPASLSRVSESDVLVRARGLTKWFGDFTAVDGIDLLWRAAYLAILGLIGLYVSGRRLARLLLV